jgi:hypothetical protein
MPSWDAVAAIAESVGAIGVIATLAYLAAQIRQNTRAIQAQATFDANHSYALINDALAAQPDLLQVVVRGQTCASLANLSEQDRIRFAIWCRTMMLRVESQFVLHRNGFLDGELWGNRRAWARGFLDQPAVAEWWAGEKPQGFYSPSFIANIDVARGIRINMAGIAFPRAEAGS